MGLRQNPRLSRQGGNGAALTEKAGLVAILRSSIRCSLITMGCLGDALKARSLIRSADLDPQMLEVVDRAFEKAWEEVAPQLSSRLAVMAAARMTLAEIVLQLAQSGIRDVQVLNDAAVRAMLNLPTKL